MFDPFDMSNRATSFSANLTIGRSRCETPRREKKGSKGFLLFRCKSWSTVIKCEAWRDQYGVAVVSMESFTS